MVKAIEFMRILERLRDDGIVIAAQQSRFPWAEVSQHTDLDIPFAGCMSKGSSVGLGIALATPGRKVIVLDADGSLLMNLGALITIANKAPQNLYHFVIENGVYAGTGGQPVPGEGKRSFRQMAQSAGYARSYQFEDLEEFATEASRILNEKGPVLVCLKVEPEVETRPIGQRPRTRRMSVAFPEVKATIASGR